MLTLTINGRSHTVGDDVDPQRRCSGCCATRSASSASGGCGVSQCSACTVPADGRADPVLPGAGVYRRRAADTAIEGLARTGSVDLQPAWIEDVAQCGYCQAGQMMRATALLAQNPKPTDDDIDRDMAANLCRCGTYTRIRKAIHSAAAKMAKNGGAR